MMKAIRIITTAPFMALLLLCGCFVPGNVFRGGLDFALSVLFLTVLPLSAYPLQPVCPHFKHKGREGQRDLAIIFAVVGYVAGVVYSLLSGAYIRLFFIFVSYLSSGLLIFLSTALLRVRASGHACGITGPMILALILGVPCWWIAIPLFGVVMAASLKMKRHTVIEFLLGGLIPVCVCLIESLLPIFAF